MKKFLTLAMTAILLFSSMTVNAAEVSMTAKQNADYMMSTNKDGAPNWFNGAYYSDRYEDLKVAFNTNEKVLYNHSLQYGFNEARLVTPVLDVAKYRAFYPDLDKAFGDNWKLYVRHYFEYGINEGRENFTDFDAKTYLSMYADLQNAFGTDLGLATRHYIEFGLSEGRAYNWPEPEISLEYTIEEENDSDDSNSSSSDEDSSDNTTEENFTGDKRVELSDNMYAMQTYVDGLITQQTIYNTDGTEESKIVFTYDEDNVLKLSVIYYADGSFVETTHYESKFPKTVTQYRTDGTKDRYAEYTEQGKETLNVEYQADGITEEFNTKTAYDENGNMISDKTIFADGSSTENTYENGVIVSRVDILADGTKVEAEYYEDGETVKKSTTINLDGTKLVTEFYENGEIKSDTEYDENDNMTRQQLYDEDGNLILDTYYTIATPAE